MAGTNLFRNACRALFQGASSNSKSTDVISGRGNTNRVHLINLCSKIPACVTGQSKDVADHFAVNIGQTTLNAIVVETQLFVVQTEQVQCRRVQVVTVAG